MAKLASLVVDLQVQSAQLREGLEQANRKLDDFGKRAGSVGKALEQVFSAALLKEAVTGLANIVMKGAEAADAMGKLAASVGVPVEQLSQLDYAANMAGIATADMGIALRELAKHMSSAFAGGKDSARIFHALGISIADSSGQLRSAKDILGDVAEKFAGLQDGVAKTTLAQELFGKSGSDLIPLLNDGRAGLADMAAESDRFGATVTEQGAKSAQDFNDALRRLTSTQGVTNRVTQALTPSLTALADELLNSSAGTETMNTASKALELTIRGLVAGGIILSGIFEAVGKTLGGVASAVVSAAHGQFKEALEAVKQVGSDFDAIDKATHDRIAAVLAPADAAAAKTEAATKKATEGHKKLADGVLKTMEAEKKAEEERAKAAEKAARHAEEMIKAQAASTIALQHELVGVDKEAAAKRESFGAAGTGAGPNTRGFAGFDAALTEFTDKLKESAFEASRAALLEKDEKYGEARLAKASADALKELSDKAGSAADAFTKIKENAAEARQGMLNKALGGDITGLIAAGTQGAAAGATLGPHGAAIGAAAGVGLELITKSAQFSKLMEAVSKVVGGVADGLGKLIEPLLPIVGLLAEVGGILGDLLVPVVELLTPVFMLLFEVLRGLLVVVLTVEKAMMDGIKALGGNVDSSRVDAGLDRLTRATFDAADATAQSADATAQMGRAAAGATEALTNAPAGFKSLALARWRATGEGMPGIGGGGGAGPPVEVNITVDGPELARAIKLELKRDRARGRGTSAELAPEYAGT